MMMADEPLEAVIQELRRQTRNSDVLQGGTLVARLEQKTKLDAAAIRTQLKAIKMRGWIEASSWSATGNPVGRVRVRLPALPPPAWHEKWNAALVAYPELSDADRQMLSECGACLADMDATELPKIVDGLVRLRRDQLSLCGMPKFLVSARYLRASSKMLNKLGTRAIRAFGIDLDLFPDHPPYVVTAGASNPKAVVLVENPTSFELAARTSAIQHCAFIATFGFGLSKSSEDFGNQLACMVEDGLSGSITLMREGSTTPTARELLAHPNITFWGDLDIAGMQIYERIGKHLPAIALSALYEPMVEALTVNDLRHSYVAAVGKSGQSMFSATREDSRRLLGYCQDWAVDQELVTTKQIEQLAGNALGTYRAGDHVE